MILRVLDHYNEFHCIADKCKDSCCIGWEIDIDEDTYDYYQTVEGKLGQRLKENMYETEEGDYSFRLAEEGRCPFLNKSNLCDICAELGEEAFSEVCTEYPRFSVYYGDVLQKTLALSCEEVGRLVFTNKDPMQIVDMEVPSEEDFYEDEEEYQDDSELDYEEDPRVVSMLEKAQKKFLDIIQDRSKSLEERIADAFCYGEKLQQNINTLDAEVVENSPVSSVAEGKREEYLAVDWQKAKNRFYIFEQMETLDKEWENQKDKLNILYEKESDYRDALNVFLSSSDYRVYDFEHLLVYFIFRYGMTAAVDSNIVSKLRLALEFTLLIRDMAAFRFKENEGSFTTEDMIDIARIFSKEVEHSEENVAYAEEEFLFS